MRPAEEVWDEIEDGFDSVTQWGISDDQRARVLDLIRARDAEVRAATLEQYEHALTEETDTHHRTVRVPCDCEHPERHRRLAGDDTPPTHAALEPVRVRRYVTPWEPDPRTPEQASDDAIAQLRARLTGQEES